MRTRHLDISARLEITRRHGLVESYRVESERRSFGPPRITVKGRPATPPEVTRNYVTALLAPYVSSRRIDVI